MVSAGGPDGVQWREAWDDIIPGYKARRYDTEREAAPAARQLRATLTGLADCYNAATWPVD
jgi:hypothetical protein